MIDLLGWWNNDNENESLIINIFCPITIITSHITYHIINLLNYLSSFIYLSWEYCRTIIFKKRSETMFERREQNNSWKAIAKHIFNKSIYYYFCILFCILFHHLPFIIHLHLHLFYPILLRIILQINWHSFIFNKSYG